jgi:hypothetical protein
MLRRRFRAYLRERDLGHHGVLGEGGAAHEVPDRLVVPAQARRPVREETLILLLANRQAEVRAVAEAVLALAALRREERHDVVARHDRRNAWADLLDDARALVPEHGRRVPGRIGARGGVQIRMADAARNEPDEHLACLRLRQVDLLDDERLAELLEDCGPDPHGSMLAQARPNRVLGCLRDGADTKRRR